MNYIKKTYRILLLIAVVIPVSRCSKFEPRTQTNGLKILNDSSLIRYDPMIFGQFIEHFHREVYGGIYDPNSKLSDAQGFRTDVIEALKEIKVPVVRWPGGCFVSSYHWINGVGKTRTPMYDKAWHVEEPNMFGTDEFIEWCKRIGAEPYICTNAGTGSMEEMSDWVEYCNLKDVGKYARMRIQNGHLDPYNVKYWSIGNENYGFWEMGAKTKETWGDLVRESGKLMLNVDPSIKLFAAAVDDPDWTMPLLEKSGRILKYVSIHGYWDRLHHYNNPANYLECMMYTMEPEKQIVKTIGIIEDAGFINKLCIAFDEWNLRGWHHPWHGDPFKPMDIKARDKNDLNETYTMADAVFSGCFLNSCLRQSKYVRMACMSPVVNVRGPLYAYPGGIVRRTTFYVFKMYSHYLEPYVLPSISSGESFSENKEVKLIDAVVTCSKDRQNFSVVLINKHPEKVISYYLDIEGMPNRVNVIMLEGDSTDAYNDVENPDRVIPEETMMDIENNTIQLPPHSVNIVHFSVR